MPPVTVISPEGEAFTVDEAEAADLVNAGFRVESTAAGTTRVLGEEQERAYGDRPVTAGALGLARGATFGLSDLALEGLGVEKEAIRETRERNRAASLTGELVGDVGGALLSGGTGVAGRLGRATLSGQLTRLGERAAGQVIESRLGRAAAANAIEGAIAAPAQYLAEQRLSEDPEYSAEVLIAQSGRGILLGGALGGGFHAAGEGLGALARRMETGSSPTKLGDALDALRPKEADELAAGATKPQAQVKPKKQSVRSVIPLDERSKEAVLERAGEFSRAISDQSSYARGVRREIRELVPNLPPRQAAELQIAEQALRDATATALRQFRDIGRAVNRGEMPALGADMEGAVSTLSRLDQARAALDERLLAARAPAGTTPAPKTPVPAPDPATPRAAPEGFDPKRWQEFDTFMRRLESRGVPEAAKETYARAAARKALGDVDEFFEYRGKRAIKPVGTTGMEGGVRRSARSSEIAQEYERRFGRGEARGAADDADDAVRRATSDEPKLADEDLARFERDPESGDFFDPETGEVLTGRNWGRANELYVDQVLARAPGPESLAELAEARRAIKSAADYAARRTESRIAKSRIHASQQRHAVAVARAMEAAGEDTAGALDEVSEATRLLREDIAAARNQGKVTGTLREEQAQELVDLWRGASSAPAPARAGSDIVDDALVDGGPARATDDRLPPPKLDEPAAPTPAPGDPLKARDLISPGKPPEKGKGKLGAFGKLGADAAAILDTAQSLGLGPSLIPEPLSPLLKMYAGYRALRMAGARLGVLKQTEATKAAAAVTEARDRITRAARKAAEGGQRALGSRAAQSAAARAAIRLTAPEAREEIRSVQELQQSPEKLQSRVDAVLAVAPNPVIQAGAQVAARKLAYLAKVAPRSPWAGTPFANEWDPTPLEVDRWQETRAALERPLEILEALSEGNYSPEAIDAIREVYPEVFGGYRRAVLDQIDQIVANAPYSTRVVMGDALDIPLDGTQMPFYERGVLEASAALAAAGGQDGQPRGASYIPAQSAVAMGAQTAAQRRAMR